MRHSELGAGASMSGAGSGIDTRCEPAIVAGLWIGVSCGEAIASFSPAASAQRQRGKTRPVCDVVFHRLVPAN